MSIPFLLVAALLSGPTISGAINNPTNAIAKLVETEKDDHKLVNEVFLRVLNRPASEPETEKALKLISAVDADYVSITNELGPLEIKLAPAIAEVNKQREEAIAKAKADLATYDEMTKSLRAELEKRREAEITMRQSELKDHEKMLPAQAAFWELKNNPAEPRTTWVPIEPKQISTTNNTKVTRQPDGSYLTSGGKSPDEFLALAHSPLTNITGVMLEVLPDDALPQFGPGRHGDGNFVLSEIGLKWAAGTNLPDLSAKFVDARADFSQNDYSVQQAIDGRVETGRNGWAIGGAPNLQRHTATFKLEQPIASTNGVTLRFSLHQNFGEDFLLGRFRLYVTTSDDPLDFGIPEAVVQAGRAPAGQRRLEQAAAILDYYRNTDVEFWKRKQALVKASDPLPVDPKFTELQNGLKKAEEPVRLDPHLVQLREDSKLSAEQRENKRLVAMQDLTWALVNSAGFLFNH